MKKSILVVSLLLAASNANAFYFFQSGISFHYKTQTGNVGSALNGNKSKDLYIITCPKGSVSADANIKDLPPFHKAPLLLQLQAKTTLSSTIYDKIDSDEWSSLNVSLNLLKTTTKFLAHVTKPASLYKGSENYELSVNCYVKHSTGSYTTEPLSIKLYRNNLSQ